MSLETAEVPKVRKEIWVGVGYDRGYLYSHNHYNRIELLSTEKKLLLLADFIHMDKIKATYTKYANYSEVYVPIFNKTYRFEGAEEILLTLSINNDTNGNEYFKRIREKNLYVEESLEQPINHKIDHGHEREANLDAEPKIRSGYLYTEMPLLDPSVSNPLYIDTSKIVHSAQINEDIVENKKIGFPTMEERKKRLLEKNLIFNKGCGCDGTDDAMELEDLEFKVEQERLYKALKDVKKIQPNINIEEIMKKKMQEYQLDKKNNPIKTINQCMDDLMNQTDVGVDTYEDKKIEERSAADILREDFIDTHNSLHRKNDSGKTPKDLFLQALNNERVFHIDIEYAYVVERFASNQINESKEYIKNDRFKEFEDIILKEYDDQLIKTGKGNTIGIRYFRAFSQQGQRIDIE